MYKKSNTSEETCLQYLTLLQFRQKVFMESDADTQINANYKMQSELTISLAFPHLSTSLVTKLLHSYLQCIIPPKMYHQMEHTKTSKHLVHKHAFSAKDLDQQFWDIQNLWTTWSSVF
jgi:hypothetical protein